MKELYTLYGSNFIVVTQWEVIVWTLCWVLLTAYLAWMITYSTKLWKVKQDYEASLHGKELEKYREWRRRV